MNEIQKLSEDLSKAVPFCVVSLDEPAKVDGLWFLDVFIPSNEVAVCPEKHAVVIWQNGRFGVSYVVDAAYGEASDEVYTDLETTFRRLLEILGEN